MIEISLSLSPLDSTDLSEAARKKLGAREIKKLVCIKKSVDARKKNDVRYLYRVAVETENDRKYLRGADPYVPETVRLADMVGKRKFSSRPVVVGSGPAGLFCALTLAYAGANPIVLERGEEVDERAQTVEKFFETGKLSLRSNVQFGEGGAGTFSDGKLNTTIHNEFVAVVLREFVLAGAPDEILYLAKPHIGTDLLRTVVKNIRSAIIALGGEFRFSSCMTDVLTVGGSTVGVMTEGGRVETKNVFLALGHSARDTFEMLYRKSVVMESKIFSMGARIEHLRKEIDRAQYGSFADKMGAADYKLATSTPGGRSLYTFCMCPGGQVINASSEEGGVCVNGMSYHARDGVNSNSALLVNVGREDFGSDHPLAGMEFQRKYERLTYMRSGAYKPVVQRYEDFVKGRPTASAGRVKPGVRGEYVFGDLREILPAPIVKTIEQGVPLFGRKIKGFDDPDGILTGIEARSSSPVRILRDEKYCSSLSGLYPIGEGAGYAGGIMSAAVDGVKSALTFINNQ